MICRRLVEGCADCVAEEQFLISVDHVCEPDGEWFTAWCTWTGRARRDSEEFHQVSHEPTRCEKCQTVLMDKYGLDRIVVGACSTGRCSEWLCPECGEMFASDGPVDCSACGSLAVLRSMRKLTTSRIRRQYAQKRRR